MRRPGRHASFALCLVAAMLWASAASARTERFSWTQTNASSVNNFRIYWGTLSGLYTSSIDVGVPAVDAQGAFSFDLLVADTIPIYVTVTAFAGGLESDRSNERMRPGIAVGTTPPPPPPPPSAAPSAAIVGFTLWNAQSDTLVDADFKTGETIPDAVRACAAIEIRTNAYLQGNGPGSVRASLDGAAPGGCENWYPYSLGDDSGVGKFACTASLAQSGSHTLAVTPYTGDNCTGVAGAPRSLSFTVAAPPAPPASTLGAPGQPHLVQ